MYKGLMIINNFAITGNMMFVSVGKDDDERVFFIINPNRSLIKKIQARVKNSKYPKPSMVHSQRKHGFLYIAKDESGIIKVGGAFNVKLRISQLNKKHRLTLIAYVPAVYFMQFEKFIHIQLKEHRIANEWYDNEKEVLKIIMDFTDKHGVVFGAESLVMVSTKTPRR